VNYKRNFLYYIILLFLVYGCETVSDFVGGSGDEIAPVDQVGQLLSDIQDEEEQLANVETDNKKDDNELENLEVSEEKLEPVPTKEYNSVLIENNQDSPLQEETSDIDEEKIKNRKFQDYQNTISKFSIKDKIQYRVATISFHTGSSKVNGIGLKKIKKIAKIAKERNAKIKIVGHASKRTRDMPLAKHKIVNFKISHKRAQSVANIFVQKYKFPNQNLITEAVSDSKPLFQENMPAGTKANQRTEIFLIY